MKAPAMRVTNRWMRIATTLAAVVALAGGAAFVPPPGNGAFAQSSSFGDVQRYRSEQFGWYFFYDASVWTLEESSSEPGSEFARFFDGEVYVDYFTFDIAGMTPEQCVADVITTLSDDPAISDIVALSEEPGPPQVMGGGELPFAFTPLVVTVEGSEGPFTLATLETCAAVGDGSTFVYRSINVPAVAYNEGRQFWSGESPEIVSSVEFAGLFELGFAPIVPEPIPIEDASGVVVGSLAGVLECMGFSSLYVVAEGLTEGSFVVDPDAFVAHDPESNESVSLTVRWLTPEVQPPAVAALESGDLGLFELVAEDELLYDFDVYYVAQEDAPVFLGSASACAGAGGGLPVAIDIE